MLAIRSSALILIVVQIGFIVSSIWWQGIGYIPTRTMVVNALFFCLGGYIMVRNYRWLLAYFASIALIAAGHAIGRENVLGIIIGEAGLSINMVITLWAIVLHSFLRAGIPGHDRLLAGIAGYLLLGIFWGFQYMMMIDMEFEPLKNVVTGTSATVSECVYFSFVTLTGVGFGDIVAVCPAARVCAIFNAITGVLYTAIFISTIVGRLSIHRDGKPQ